MAKIHLNDAFWQNYDEVINQTLVPQLPSDFIQPYTEEHFQSFRTALVDNFHDIFALLDTILKQKNQWTTKTKKNIVKVIIILGEHHCKNLWNTDELVEITKLWIPKICLIFGLANMSQVLKDNEIFLSILMFLRPKLLKDTWKNSPASVACYQWILMTTEKPQLKNYVPDVLPTALIIFDDYVLKNQILGLECINLIINHCQKSRSLISLNYDKVIFEALERMINKIDKENISIIIPLYSCISDLLDIMKYCDNSNISFGWTRQDDILGILLNEMELQTNYEFRHAYATSLIKFIMHSSVGKWSERLTRILSEYCQDDIFLKTTNLSLDLLQTMLSVYQPKNVKFYIEMYSSLLKLKHKIVNSHQDTKEIIEKTEKCINSLTIFCPNISREIMESDVIKNIIIV